MDLHFLGAWYRSFVRIYLLELDLNLIRDTVSSVGILRGRLLPLIKTCEHVSHFRHALALDERRVKFLPEHVKTPEELSDRVKEVWFAGTHSDM